MVRKKFTTRIRKDDKNFRRDVIRAKMEYRKKRAYIILTIAIILLSFIFIRTFLYSQEKAELEKSLQNQQGEIQKLKNDAKVNEIVIAKLKDPNFIIDLVRQEYYMGYKGETIFNMPLRENYLDNAIKSIMSKDLDKQLAEIDTSKQINDEQIESIMIKRAEERRRLEEERRKLADKANNSSEEDLEKEILEEEGISTERNRSATRTEDSTTAPAARTTTVARTRTNR